jgi:hypothetical protein
MFHIYWPFLALIATITLLIVIVLVKFSDKLFHARLSCAPDKPLEHEADPLEDFLGIVNEDFALREQVNEDFALRRSDSVSLQLASVSP